MIERRMLCPLSCIMKTMSMIYNMSRTEGLIAEISEIVRSNIDK